MRVIAASMIGSSRHLKSLVAVLVRQAPVGLLNKSVPFFYVCIRTGIFNPEEAKYASGVVVDMPYPTDDVRLLT